VIGFTSDALYQSDTIASFLSIFGPSAKLLFRRRFLDPSESTYPNKMVARMAYYQAVHEYHRYPLYEPIALLARISAVLLSVEDYGGNLRSHFTWKDISHVVPVLLVPLYKERKWEERLKAEYEVLESCSSELVTMRKATTLMTRLKVLDGVYWKVKNHILHPNSPFPSNIVHSMTEGSKLKASEFQWHPGIPNSKQRVSWARIDSESATTVKQPKIFSRMRSFFQSKIMRNKIPQAKASPSASTFWLAANATGIHCVGLKPIGEEEDTFLFTITTGEVVEIEVVRQHSTPDTLVLRLSGNNRETNLLLIVSSPSDETVNIYEMIRRMLPGVKDYSTVQDLLSKQVSLV